VIISTPPSAHGWRGHDTIVCVADWADWVWWLIAAGALVIAELFSGTFVLLMFGVGAFAASVVSLAGAPGWVAALVFAAVSALALWLVRPMINKRLHKAEDQKMGMATTEGAAASVIERVDRDHGMVKIGGELWRARPYDSEMIYEPGERVRVLRVDGATAMVGRD
jgi:membrane protein implicated in regulation of membrane protease activity